MGLSKIILNIALRILDVLTFFVKQDSKRITFVSLTQSELSSDFKKINDLLGSDEFHIHYNLIEFESNLLGQLKYFFNCLKQLIDLKKSKLVILNDNNYVVSFFKPEQTKVLQIWHAPGAVKKFGNQIKRQYPIQNYDYVICNSEYWKAIYSECFNVKEEQVIVTGLPRMDDLLKDTTSDFYIRHPECKNKKLILYAPTFRGNIIDGLKSVCMDFDQLHLNEDEILLCKFHPLLKDMEINHKQVINVSKEDLYDLMKVSHLLISDYSSVFFDYCLLEKPVIAFVPDYESYEKQIGFNIDLYSDFDGPICTNEQQLNEVIHCDLKIDSQFQRKFVEYTDGMNSYRVVNLIKQIMNH
ncbi:MAG: CDP-glycerol glycerophosphotransferase family protein [Erysipelotrichaceae bacterium]|uniref:CDP-glycerol glycerophosphotransferase family protein n=1 Tax=Floccifex sp. TaxID=2815810 RepID=UPI002A76306E|nr:CDP-glycerol glycerophosphotransferase family protein [Floccifex sp.]MDD7280577.1 CDP-glycerol glycerophosphotransferase family protein [Erysipelotrichaceae bacterium]MDY2958644.1 CDP-glycerol glycerophosphotransferase family protein [Floccifex sp.]